MTPEEIRLKCLDLVISKAPQGFDVGTAIDRARILAAFVSDTSKEPERLKGTLSINADTAKSPRKP